MENLPTTILSSLENLFLQFNYRRLLFWLFIIVVALLLLSGIEGLTGFTYFMRVQGKLSALSSLNTLSYEGIENNPELSPIYDQIVNDISHYDIDRNSVESIFPGISALSLQIPDEFWKFISGGIWGFLVAISGFFMKRSNKEGWQSIMLGGLTMGVIFGIISSIIPNILSIWVNIYLCPSIQLVFIIILPKLFSKKK